MHLHYLKLHVKIIFLIICIDIVHTCMQCTPKVACFHTLRKPPYIHSFYTSPSIKSLSSLAPSVCQLDLCDSFLWQTSGLELGGCSTGKHLYSRAHCLNLNGWMHTHACTHCMLRIDFSVLLWETVTVMQGAYFTDLHITTCMQ